MLGSYIPQPSEKVDKILKSGSATIEELMGEDDTLADLRSNCAELIRLYEHSVIPSFTFGRVDSMIDYIVKDPAEDADDKVKFK